MEVRRLTMAVLSLCALFAAGCGVNRYGTPSADEWRLAVLGEVTIPAGRARALFQNGRQVAHVDLHHPHCELEINTVDERPQVLLADTFYVTRRAVRTVSNELTAMPASIISPLDCSEDLYYESLFWLVSERKQNVRMLICRDWSMSCHFGRHLTLAEILQVLGPGFKLE